MRAATTDDIPAITAFLGQRIETAMFPLSNLARHGMAGGHPHAMRFWLAGDPLAGVLGLTEGGMVMPNLRPADVPAARVALAGQRVAGIAGPADCALPLHAACGLSGAPTQMTHVEPQFALDLDDLRLPVTRGLTLTLTPLDAAPRALLLDWGAAYDVEILGARPDTARAAAGAVLDAWIRADSHRVLWQDGQPVARTGFNARLPAIVQIGGVYVPPALRQQGLARAAVALHLVQARAAGVRRATLFSASDHAARAYRAIGFRQVGQWFLCLLDGDWMVPLV